MPELSDWLLMLLLAGVGSALFFAGREFFKGFKSAAGHDHTGGGPEQERAGPDDAGAKTEQPQREEPRQLPWHQVLEVAANASAEEIKAGYRRMIALYHPDRVDGLGIELRAVAERRAKEINQAYAIARKIRSF